LKGKGFPHCEASRNWRLYRRKLVRRGGFPGDFGPIRVKSSADY